MQEGGVMRSDIGSKAMKTGLVAAGLAALLLWMKIRERAPRPSYAMTVGEDSDAGPSGQEDEAPGA